MATTQRLVNAVCLIFTLLLVINYHIRPAGATGCWNSFVNTNVANGEGRNATTLDACKTACVSNSSCTGFDWVTNDDRGKQCWLSGPWSGARNDGGRTGVNHYDFDRSCQGNTRPPTPAPPTTEKPKMTVLVSESVSSTDATSVNGPIARPLRIRSTDQVHAIRPAYIVLAGLGAGNILLVVVAVIIICRYPLNRSKLNQNGVSDRVVGVGGGGGGGGGNSVEHHEMENKHREYDDDDNDYHDDGYANQQQQHHDIGYNDDNEINDRRYSRDDYDDDEPQMNVEDNPYFNRSELGASAAF